MDVKADISVEALQTIVMKICPAIKTEGYDIMQLEGKDGTYSIVFQTRPSARERSRASGPSDISGPDVKTGPVVGPEAAAPVCGDHEGQVLDRGLQRPSRRP